MMTIALKLPGRSAVSKAMPKPLKSALRSCGFVTSARTRSTRGTTQSVTVWATPSMNPSVASRAASVISRSSAAAAAAATASAALVPPTPLSSK